MRNEIKINKNGSFCQIGLNENEKNSLKEIKQECKQRKIHEENIFCYYDFESNEKYFALSSYGTKAIYKY